MARKPGWISSAGISCGGPAALVSASSLRFGRPLKPRYGMLICRKPICPPANPLLCRTGQSERGQQRNCDAQHRHGIGVLISYRDSRKDYAVIADKVGNL